MKVKTLRDILETKGRITRFDIDQAVAVSHEMAQYFNEQKLMTEHFIMQHGDLEFVCCVMTPPHKNRIVWPALITDYLIVGWEDCDACKKFKRFLPEMDSVTLTSTTGRPLEQAIKKIIRTLKLETDLDFPFVMHKDGTHIIRKHDLRQKYGVTL